MYLAPWKGGGGVLLEGLYMGWFENETIFTLFYKEKNFFLLISIFDLFSIKKIFGVDFFFFLEQISWIDERTQPAKYLLERLIQSFLKILQKTEAVYL